MKRIIKAVCSFIITFMVLTRSFSVYALEFDAEQTFDSVFVVLSDNALGSGFALGEHCVITNAHVIQNTSDVNITAYDGKIYHADVYCKDDDLDIAVLSVPSSDFIPLAIGNTADIKIGEDVIAIGAPNGMSYTLTKGTLSSNKRIISGESYLQIDAALNEGNSGGPLLNANGDVIGMNTMKMNNSEGLGLAIPIDRILLYMENNEISISNDGIIEVPEIIDTPDSTVIPSSDSITAENREKTNKENSQPLIIALLCVSIILNIIMILMTLHYRSKWRQAKIDQSERTDFEIDIWE